MRDFDPTAGEFAGSDAIQMGSRKFDPGTLMAGAQIVGGLIGSDSAGNAADAQAGATRVANALQEKQYQQTRTDLAPWRNAGTGAVNKLQQLLGIGGAAGGGVMTADQARAQLLSQYTKPGAVDTSGGQSTNPFGPDFVHPIYGRVQADGSFAQPASTVDENGLSAAVQQLLAQQQSQANQGAQSPDYGSLLKPFTGADLQNEPGYQFGMQQGQQALDNRFAAAGSYLSGAALKGATRYAQDYAGTKYGEAFNRDASNKRTTYDFLNGTSSSGQNAATMTGNAGTAMAGQVGANTTAMGNALGAAGIAQGNAIGGGLTNAANGYQQNKLMQAILGGNQGFGAPQQSRGYTVPNYPGAEY